jgi:type II secretory pathway pseudopilin PulG
MLNYKNPFVILVLILISAVAGSLGAKSLMSRQRAVNQQQAETHGTIRHGRMS